MTKLEQVELVLDGKLKTSCPCSTGTAYGPHGKQLTNRILYIGSSFYFMPCENHLKFYEGVKVIELDENN